MPDYVLVLKKRFGAYDNIEARVQLDRILESMNICRDSEDFEIKLQVLEKGKPAKGLEI